MPSIEPPTAPCGAGFTGQGFDARYAAAGWTALRAIDDERPEVLVVDIHVPGLRGDELLAEIAGHPAPRHIPAIVVTGSDIDMAVGQAKQILRKPCASEHLVAAIERFAEAA